jgi:outer membrane protein
MGADPRPVGAKPLPRRPTQRISDWQRLYVQTLRGGDAAGPIGGIRGDMISMRAWALAAALSGTLTVPGASQTTGVGAPAGSPGAGPASMATDTVGLEEAVDRALRIHPQMVQAETGLRSAAMGTRQAYANFLPTLSASSGASLSSSERFDPTTNLRITGQTDSYSAGLSSGLDLFTGGRNRAAVRSAHAGVDAAEAALVTRRYAVALATKRTFFSVLRAEDLIRIAEERIRQAEENLGAAERRLRAGRATRSDVLRAELQLSNARQAHLEAQTQRRTAMYSLGQAVGVTEPVAARRPPTLEPAPLALSPDRMREVVLAEAPVLVSTRAGIGVASAGVAQARAQYLPTIGLRAGYNWSNSQFGFDDGRTSWNTSLGISYPLFNGLQREVNLDRASAQLAVAEAQAADAARAAISDLERLLAGLELNEQRIALLHESVGVAREDYRVQQARYEHGTTTILELVSSQIALVQAEYDLINARYDYQITKAELEALVGREL